jgi:secreted PhoX family phosphatase
LSCEENWHGYFARLGEGGDAPAGAQTGGRVLAGQARYGIGGSGAGYHWHEFDARFDVSAYPHEPHRFGWVVEIDPYDPASIPVKRTALGRIKHEGATVTLAKDGRVVVYLGDDERFEYIYKYVSRDPFRPGKSDGNAQLLDEGTLFVARFFDDGSGVWLPLRHGESGLTAQNGFRDQAEVLVYTRLAADRVGATPMDRPEWIAVHPETREVYCSLTNNERRGVEGEPPVNGPNPRPENHYGHIIRWREAGNDPAALSFAWDVFILCGKPKSLDQAAHSDVEGDRFGSPDGLWFDRRGLLWIQTDVSNKILDRGPYRGFGNNQMLAADVRTGEVRRFLTGPRGGEVAGVTMSPDGRTLFVNIQHPGEPEGGRSAPANPKVVSSWPDGEGGGRPRSATLAIYKDDRGLIGT